MFTPSLQGKIVKISILFVNYVTDTFGLSFSLQGSTVPEKLVGGSSGFRGRRRWSTVGRRSEGASTVDTPAPALNSHGEGQQPADVDECLLGAYMWCFFCIAVAIQKLVITVYTALRDGQPSYLAGQLTCRQAVHGTRSGADETALKTQRTNTKLADCRFSAPVFWNAVPQNIQECSTITSFKRHLKM